MNNTTLQLKIKQRLNKLSSNDYDNIECWQIVEAYNKGRRDWCRRNLHGLNIVKEGDEASKRRKDDLQILLTESGTVLGNSKDGFIEYSIPGDYLEWKRVSANATNDCCHEGRRMMIYLVEEGNLDELLRDYNKKPSFEWGETFATLKDGNFRIYTNNEFVIYNVNLSYYRQPVNIQIQGCVDPYTGLTSTVDVECEFKDDLTELFIDEAVKILAGDIESINQLQRASQSVENNN
jgi:hypothetical protein